ncbi:hypothetical protein [Treponema putidum]|uniref:Lipoprotein n=1 Tax=Treponema putidum TaxID=221027 RepID=A0AAE9MUI4_9SPIR|nr:hypothetical protein [Treponema putidum]AIN92710.1 hypothetical protein JO40_00015 [Treponema putidum]TWI75285.1 hypothetical protein JM98_02052 [Treponema putidum]UTY28949.1 hypothetical protein E4N76_08110 [Treponema putidum]UTY31362.1 hypothetical protein E4N75_07505 [Treponema putidum]UTY33800.1 hypothetical protein E4N74_07135 [Treponema putidum]
MKIMKKISILTAIMICFVCCFACAKDSDKDGYKTNYKIIADSLNKQCPTKIDDNIQLDEVNYVEDSHTLQYIYSFTAMLKSDNTEDVWKLIESATKEALTTEFKSQTSVEQFRKDKLNMEFVYNDKNKESLFTIVLTPGEY